MRKIIIMRMVVACFVVLMPLLSHAQPGFGDDETDVPLDGGLSLVVAAGVGYGLHKMRKHRKEQQGKEQ